MMASVTNGFMSVLRTSLGSDYLFVPPAVGIWQNDVGATNSLADSLRRIDGVDHVSTLRYASTMLGAGATRNPASLLGVDPKEFPLVSSLAFSGGSAEKAFAGLAAGRGMIANPILASSLGLKVGSTVAIDTPEGQQDYQVVGIATDFLDAKIAAAFVSQGDLARDFHRTDDVLIQLNLKTGVDEAAAAAAIRAAGAQYPQFSIIQGREYFTQMSGLFDAVFAALYVLFAFLALPSLLTTLNTLAISVIERTREIGMLRAVGTTRRQVGRTVLAESLLLAALGTAFGLIAGLYLGYLLVKGMATVGFPAPYVFPWVGLVSAVVIGLVFGALAAIIPARKAAQLEIVQALRYE
jgi:putative ABC transport system permease protein